MTALERTLTISMPVVLRIAEHSDLPKLEWYGQYAHFRNLFRRAFREQQLGRRLILLADSNGFPVGQVFIHFIKPDSLIDERQAYLYSFRVMEMFRGYGIGTRLLVEAETIAAQRGFQWATIAAAKDNLSARRLYERLGYRVYGEDAGNWSYIDHQGVARQVHEPCWMLRKKITLR